jgi:hypothetical protein
MILLMLRLRLKDLSCDITCAISIRQPKLRRSLGSGHWTLDQSEVLRSVPLDLFIRGAPMTWLVAAHMSANDPKRTLIP